MENKLIARLLAWAIMHYGPHFGISVILLPQRNGVRILKLNEIRVCVSFFLFPILKA